MRFPRGGHTLKPGKIGHVNCVRQTMMMPGEVMDVEINGKVRLETLRERDVMRINAQHSTFITPIRWLWSDWPDYVKQGPDTGLSPPQATGNVKDVFGVGANSVGGNFWQWYITALTKVHAEWFKWPEDPDWSYSASPGQEHGPPAVPLQKTWSRCRYQVDPDSTTDYSVPSATQFDVRDLAEFQAKFRSAMKRDVFSYERWMELIQETWKGKGSPEVDQVPRLVDNVSIGVNPREMPATDGPSFGTWQSMFDFNISHRIPNIVAPEHCILTHVLTIRFAGTLESIHPLAQTNLDWYELTGDPEFLAAASPVEVEHKELFGGISTTSMGYLPAGWQWRADHDVIGEKVDIRDSFPYMKQPTTKEEAKDASRVKNAFSNQALDDYLADIFYKENSSLPIGDSMDSYMAGMMDDAQVKPGARGQEFPKGGKML